MVIVDLKSAGIGNCMFQYAAGKALSVKYGTKLKFDITSLDKEQMPYHPLTLDEKIDCLQKSILAFNVTFEIATEDEVRHYRRVIDERGISSRYGRKIIKMISPYKKSVFKEQVDHEYDQNFFSSGKDVYLDGIFINPRYFSSIKDDILEDFTIKGSMFNQTETLKKISNSESVSIHIRRGDYTDQSQTGNIYPTYGVGYVSRAIEVIKQQKKHIKLFVFSDDPEWCQNELELEDEVYFVSGNTAYDDFWLMRSCKNNIIVNSTFSWWAAWLNDNPQKIVVTPRKWRNDDVDTSDMILSSWKVID